MENEKDKVIEHKKFVLIDSSGEKYAGSYSVHLNLKNKDKGFVNLLLVNLKNLKKKEDYEKYDHD